ncbi:MAG: hypothetical protein ACXWNQ_06500 [Anaerolineales bacterium]
MTIKQFEPSTLRLFQYVVASADMFYSELEQRDVFLGSDENGHVRIWGEIADGGPSTKVDLCGVFLEYGLYCCSWCGAGEALYHMQDFGERLGRRLARYLQENPHLLDTEDPAISALEQLFGTLGACFSEEYLPTGIRFEVTDCPLEKVAKSSGLPYVDIARHGINAMCRTLILALEPYAVVNIASQICPKFMFTITAPLPA